MNRPDIFKRYSIVDDRIETYCIYQNCHWSIPYFDQYDGVPISNTAKIIECNNDLGVGYFAVLISRNELGFVDATFFTRVDAFNALVDRIANEG